MWQTQYYKWNVTDDAMWQMKCHKCNVTNWLVTNEMSQMWCNKLTCDKYDLTNAIWHMQM